MDAESSDGYRNPLKAFSDLTILDMQHEVQLHERQTFMKFIFWLLRITMPGGGDRIKILLYK